jgi:hypothetical protein
MLERVFSVDKGRALGFEGLAVLLLLGGAGCADEADDGVTETTSEVRVSGPNGHIYEFRTDAKNFQQAAEFCTSIGSRLADIRDATEDAWLLDQERRVFGGGGWWIGYSDSFIEGTWRWSSGRGNGYVNWHAGEPNNQNNEDCAVLNQYTDGKWNDSNCNNAFRFVCEIGADTPLPQFGYTLSNTNNATVNYAQFALDITAGSGATIGTCGVPNSFGALNTYLRLFNPWNSAQVAENNDFPNPPCAPGSELSLFSVNPSQTGTYIIHAGCAANSTCVGIIGITRP